MVNVDKAVVWYEKWTHSVGSHGASYVGDSFIKATDVWDG